VELVKIDSGSTSFRSSCGLFPSKKAAMRDMMGSLSEDGKLKTHEVGAADCFCIPAAIVRDAYAELNQDDDDDGNNNDTTPIAPDPEDHGKQIEQSATVMPQAFSEFIDALNIDPSSFGNVN
jgi:hypothetical protein